MLEQALDDNVSENEDEESFFLDVDILQKHGINVADIKKLKGAGICTLKGIQMSTKKKLCNIKGFSETKVEKIKEACLKVVTFGFMTALEVSDRRKQVFKISTGSKSMAITEVFGEFRTGKTQLSHTLCVTTQIPNGAFQGGKVMFLDTEHTLYPFLLYTTKGIGSTGIHLDIAQSTKSRRGSCMCLPVDNDWTSRSSDEELMVCWLEWLVYKGVSISLLRTSRPLQMELLDFVAAKFHEEAGIFKLLIVDSIMALFRVDFSGRGELADRQQKLAQVLSKLQKMTADPGATLSFQADPKKPIGGNILAHASTTRIALRKGRGENRIAKIYDSPDLPESEATFAITNGGVADAKD
ncbi:unnamed protein product [Leptidea sinapis]|uniref:RecA family profile 2 domain-containing protein n=1 Tax=Leptidea sinapis TaxID=189913 RepID=A0A5E4R101_9NEOP|nr:unnamed protein product [Leptidea sinapis]